MKANMTFSFYEKQTENRPILKLTFSLLFALGEKLSLDENEPKN